MISTNTTHEVHIDPGRKIVVKRFRSWSRSEPVREWTALTLLAEFAPGLAPVPVHADLSGDSPTLTMALRRTVPSQVRRQASIAQRIECLTTNQ